MAQYLGDVVVFGDPVVRQKHNVHDLWRDVDNQRNGMPMTDDFCDALRPLTLRGTGERWTGSML